MDDSLGDFDAAIRKERERIARERDARVATNGGGGAGGSNQSGGSGEGAGGQSGGREGDMQQGQGGQSSGQGANKGPGDMKSSGGGGRGSGGSSRGGGPSSAPADVPDGRDDDVIARQIREAAEKETDPELRDKLWKEYIEYKKNVQK